MSNYFELTKESKVTASGIKVFRVKCLLDFKYANKGTLGGWVESLNNLSGNAWVYGDAQVYGDARVSGNAYGI